MTACNKDFSLLSNTNVSLQRMTGATGPNMKILDMNGGVKAMVIVFIRTAPLLLPIPMFSMTQALPFVLCLKTAVNV